MAIWEVEDALKVKDFARRGGFRVVKDLLEVEGSLKTKDC